MLLQDSCSALARDVRLGLQDQIQTVNVKIEVVSTKCLTNCNAIDLITLLWDMCFVSQMSN